MLKNTLYIVRLAALLALTLIVQMIGLPQIFTGPLVNALLLLTTDIGVLGLLAGVLLGLLTPWVALIRGQLLAAAAPMVPFIMIANVTFVLLFWIFRTVFAGKRHIFLDPWIAIVLSSAGKFLVLLTAVKLLVPVMIGHHLPARIETIFTLPQFLTALAGGIIYTFLIRLWEKFK